MHSTDEVRSALGPMTDDEIEREWREITAPRVVPVEEWFVQLCRGTLFQ